jgi:hypothetical protein
METQINKGNTLLKSLAVPALATMFLLLIPLIAMQFTSEVAWTPFDFVAAGALLFGTGLVYKLITWKSSGMAYRVAVGFALFTGLFLIWVNLAVGIIGSENNTGNLMYFGVITIGIIGAFLARFKPLGMAAAMFMMALAQAMVAVIALIAGMHRLPGSSVTEIVGVNWFFFMLFIIAALLFRHAALEEPESLTQTG